MSPTLLIVDDEQDMLDFLERVFRSDYRVERARSVAEAVRVLNGGQVDVLITDHRMPTQSGIELLELAAAHHPRAVRVLLTGYAHSPTDSQNDPSKVIDGCASKPIDSDALRKAIAEAVARRAGLG